VTNFIQKPLPVGSTTGNDPRPDGRPGALDKGQRASTGLITFNRFWAYFTPLIGGWLADAKWGRLKTIQVAIALAMIGHIIIIVASIPSVIKHSSGALGCLSVGIVFFGMGVGGFKANIAPLMAEQLQAGKMRIKVLRNGERVIVDPAMTTQRSFMYFYLCINIGAIVGQITMVYAERYVGFWLSFTLPTIMFALCPLVLAIFNSRYVHRPPTGSVLEKALELMKYALKGKVSPNPVKT
jgi:proton-dependent oligopeptide transporter, POT family